MCIELVTDDTREAPIIKCELPVAISTINRVGSSGGVDPGCSQITKTIKTQEAFIQYCSQVVSRSVENLT